MLTRLAFGSKCIPSLFSTHDFGSLEEAGTLDRPTPQGVPDDLIDAWVSETIARALAYAISLVGNRCDAEDLVHDCYGRLLAKAAEYDLARDGQRLLYRSITNACINYQSRRPPVVSLETIQPCRGNGPRGLEDPREPGPESNAIRSELEQALTTALAELSVPQRAVIELKSMGHSSLEVADILGMSHANARVLLHRARQALSVRLRPFLEDPAP